MVGREGIATSTSLCKRDMILFHHRAEIGCRGWNCTSIRAFKGRCPTIRRPGTWWPARVTLPVQRIKSPLHHFNACRPKWCSRQDSHPVLAHGHQRDALDVVSWWLPGKAWTTRAIEMEPQPGVAPARFLYKRNQQAAARRL